MIYYYYHRYSNDGFQVAMRALGFDVKKVDVLKIMKDYDRESTGKITFDDFNEVSKYANESKLS